MRGARTLRPGEAGWPAGLEALPRPPAFLRVKGELPPPGARAVAVVGSRRPDEAGARLARRLGAALAGAGAWVVSGGAHGVDGAAHRGALDAGGRTLVVLGGGLDHLYPAAHRPLFARAVEGGGGLAAEREDGERPARWTFPERNRLVAALAEAVVVVRAGAASGALLTADWARRLGRPLLAAAPEGPPGATDGLRALLGLPGTGALAFREPAEALAALGLPAAAGPDTGEVGAGRAGACAGAAASRLWEVLGEVPVGADEAARAAGLEAGATAAGLAELELLGLARRLAGNRYARCGA
jgi:DNA processing protein